MYTSRVMSSVSSCSLLDLRPSSARYKDTTIAAVGHNQQQANRTHSLTRGTAASAHQAEMPPPHFTSMPLLR